MNRNRFFCIAIAAALPAFAALAQSPAPVAVVAATAQSETLPFAVKQLQQMKAANEELLKKQEAVLQRLEELQKAADEIKIFGKRS